MKSRERASPLAGCVVRCVCVCASLVATGCALLGLGLTCALLDPSSGACPRPLAVGAFAAALLAVALVLAALACRRKTLGLPSEDPPHSSEDTEVPSNTEPLTKDDAFEMTQISEEVSQWIEQQEDSASESFCLEIAEHEDGEMTAL